MELFSKMIKLTETQSNSDIANFKIKEYYIETSSWFCRGLINELELRVRQSKPNSLQDAINLDIEAEKEVRQRKKLHSRIGEGQNKGL